LIIGISEQQIEESEISDSSIMRLKPENLYKLSDKNSVNPDENIERTNVVKDFCFPDGVAVY
jgi:hypothetical protein